MDHDTSRYTLDKGERRDSINPATGEVIGQYAADAAAGVAEAQGAIDAALSTFRNTTWKEDCLLRSRVLNAMANEFERRTEDLVQLLATENGKTLPQVRFENLPFPGVYDLMPRWRSPTTDRHRV
jgi:betaine-aldehyde dehydrogenase